MEIDKREPNSILFVSHNTLKSYSALDDNVYLIAGNNGKRGYANGEGTEALFDDLTGYYQIDHESVVPFGGS